jgi:sialate O-acetylesterase
MTSRKAEHLFKRLRSVLAKIGLREPSPSSALKTIESEFDTESATVPETQADSAVGEKGAPTQSCTQIDEQPTNCAPIGTLKPVTRNANNGKEPFVACALGLLALCWWVSALPAGVAKIRLPAIFADNMVVQRDQVTKIRGTATPGIDVTVKLNERTVHTRADLNGDWVASLPPLPAGGPYTINIDGGEHITLRHILSGDVWLCSGQSNMARLMADSTYEKADVENANFPKLRIFSIPEAASDKPLRYGQGEWVKATPQSVPYFAACEFYFARELQAKTKVPIGIISCCAGGRPLNVWLSNPSNKDKNEGPFVTASIYRAMVAPILGYGVKGMIWYQGESDIFKPAHYRKNLPKMLTDLRERWNYPDMPLIIVQLPNYAEHDKQPSESLWAELREAQTQISGELKNTHLVCTYDTAKEVPVTLHPPDKRLIAHRLAETALAISKVFTSANATNSTNSPDSLKEPSSRLRENAYYQSFKVGGADSIVHFDQKAEPLDTRNKVVHGFAVAGKDKKFYWAGATVEPDGFNVRVSCPQVPSPTAVRYAWSDNPVADLYTASGRPVVPFRSDDYKALPSAYNMSGRFNFWNDMDAAQKARMKALGSAGIK